jgi:hypothetical protein
MMIVSSFLKLDFNFLLEGGYSMGRIFAMGCNPTGAGMSSDMNMRPLPALRGKRELNGRFINGWLPF